MLLKQSHDVTENAWRYVITQTTFVLKFKIRLFGTSYL
jgi:hypothetical protein